jgi:hypothetical protein
LSPAGRTPALFPPAAAIYIRRVDTKAILEALMSDPRIDSGTIEIAACGETAVLQGRVHTYAEKCWAEELVRSQPGVSDVRNELEVRITIGDYRTDETLHRLVREVIDALCVMPDVRPQVAVRDGWLTLSGDVDWPFQKRGAEESVRQIAGIRGITNEIRIDPDRRHLHPRAQRA